MVFPLHILASQDTCGYVTCGFDKTEPIFFFSLLGNCCILTCDPQTDYLGNLVGGWCIGAYSASYINTLLSPPGSPTKSFGFYQCNEYLVGVPYSGQDPTLNFVGYSVYLSATLGFSQSQANIVCDLETAYPPPSPGIEPLVSVAD